jgi:hypothetical protein
MTAVGYDPMPLVIGWPIAILDPLSRGCGKGFQIRKQQTFMRLKSAIWVAAYLRRCQVEGASAVLRRRGAEEAGAIFIKINRLDGTAELYGPAPQAEFDAAHPADRAFTGFLRQQPVVDAEVEAALTRQLRVDSDIWMIEVEDRAGRNFLDSVVP